MERLELLGLPLDPVSMREALERIQGFLAEPGTRQVVTLNPEITVRAQRDPELARAIREAELVTPDGIGVLWAARTLCGARLSERVTGVDLTLELFRRLGPKLRVFFLGGRPGVAERAAARAQAEWGVQVAGSHHGFFQDEAAVVARIRAARADLLLAGLGERQEVFLHRHKPHLGVRVAIGVGGTLDVLAGEARRAPEWTRRVGVEWLWRVGLDPKRWPRAGRLARFVGLVWRARLFH